MKRAESGISNKRLDRSLAFLLILFGLMCFLAVWMPERFGFGRFASNSSLFIGRLSKDEGDVRQKAKGELAWHDVMGANTGVSDGDTVYTGPSSEAKVDFFSGETAKILPNSMVVIRKEVVQDSASGWLVYLRKNLRGPQTVQRVELKSGSIRLSKLSATTPIEVSANGTVYRLDLRSRPSVESLDIRLGDHLQVVAGGSDTKGDLVPVGKDAESDNTPIPIGIIETNISSAFPTPVQIVPALSVQLPPVSTRIFDDEHFDYVPVKARWNAISDASEYRVVIFHGNAVFLDKIISQPYFDFRLTQLNSVPYDLQITAKLKSGAEIASTKTPLKIDSVAPSLTLPDPASLKHRSRFLIAWERTLLARKYRIQIANDPEFKAVRAERETRLNVEPFLAPPRPGKLYVRVQSLLLNGTSPWSTTRELNIE